MRLRLLLTLTTLLVVVVGCSGGGGMPVVPEYLDGDIPSLDGAADLPKALMPDAGHLLWGYWQGTFDLPTKQVEIVRLRQAEFHANLAGILRTKPLGLSYEVKGFNLLKGTASIDVTLTHPYPNSNFRGFDTRGIFMGPGSTLQSSNDPGVVYPATNGCRLLNADGYTRWWNAQEFTTTGLYGYDDDNIIPGFLIPTTTLNPYKYFADCLEADDPVIPNVDITNRGTFSTDLEPPKLTRNYKIQFPKIGGQSKFGFHYAVDVSWTPPTGQSQSPKPVGDFPIGANCQEPYYIEVDTEGTTAWYKSDTERGGDLHLAVEVFDWQASENPEGIQGEIESIWIESKTLFDSFYEWPITPDPGSDVTSGIFHFTIPKVTPTALENQEILITVRSAQPNTYAPPVDGPVYPTDAVLSAYALVNIPIKTIEPDAIDILSPVGNETWGIESQQVVTWNWAGEINVVDIDLSIDGGNSFPISLAADIPNTGAFTLASVGNWPTTQARIRVSKSSKHEIYDISDKNFTIRPYILVDVPNGTEILMAGSNGKVEWTASSVIANVAILISKNSGAYYNDAITYSAPNNGSYMFYNIPESFIGSHNRVKIVDETDETIFDESDGDFTILPELEDQIVVGAPNGGEEWIADTYEKITWAGDPDFPDVVIKLSKDSGATWPVTIIDPIPNADGEYVWGPIPEGHVGPNCRIGVFAAHNPNIYDDSDEDFAIIPPGIEVDTPMEEWQEGKQYEITYTASESLTHLDFLLSLDGGGTWPITIGIDIPNTGSFLWIVNDPALVETDQARIKIQDHDNPGPYFDESDDFTILKRTITIIYPNGHVNAGQPDEEIQTVRIGYPLTIEWEWFGNIPFVDIKMSLDGGASYPYEIITDVVNTGSFDINFLDFDWLTDYAIWDFPTKEAKIRVEASGIPSLNGASENVFIIPITLGILNTKNSAEPTGDMDDDGLQDHIEMLLGTAVDDFDSDRDGMYDFNETFWQGSYGNYDTIPNEDEDDDIAPMDTDDNDDGTHDGELVDSDMDGVPNYLEYYGFTYNWLSGQFLKYDDEDVLEDFTVPYFKTDPLQPSSDQDPYGDGMEVSGLLMDQSVLKPGNSPMVPASPNIVIRLIGYQVTLNADIEDAQGHSYSKEKNWERGTEQSSSFSMEHSWEAKVGYTAKIGVEAGHEINVEASIGGQYSWENSSSTSTSTGESIGENWEWSTSRSTNPTEAAKVKLYMKAYNFGTACASNIVPTVTLSVGKKPVTTFTPGNSQINLLPPGGVYPPGTGNYWVIDSNDNNDPIFLTLEELRAFETGAPISVIVSQMQADVAKLNDEGHWEYVGDWGEYMARVEAVCASIYIDSGDGNPINYRVYADDDPSAPEVTLGDAFIWAAGAEEKNNSIYIDYKLSDGTWTEVDLNDCSFSFDPVTWDTIQDNLDGNTFALMDIPLTPGAVIIGKAPPEPPLDEPQIHWACYDGELNIAYASVTDYYEVDKVYFVDVNPSGTEMEMSYDSNIGCYKVQLPGGFVLEEGQDYVYAENIDGNSTSIGFDVHKMPDIPDPPPESYPNINPLAFSIYDDGPDVKLWVWASIDDFPYTITEAWVLDQYGEIIGPMHHSTGLYWGLTLEIGPEWPVSGAEKIRATNDLGYSTTITIPQSVYSYPTEIMGSGSLTVPGAYGTAYCDVETNTNNSEPYESMDLWISHGSLVSLGYHLFSPLQNDKLMKVTSPSRDYIKQLYSAGLIDGTFCTFGDKSNCQSSSHSCADCEVYDESLTFIFTTNQGRFAYINFHKGTLGFYYSPTYCVYSLWEGPYD